MVSEGFVDREQITAYFPGYYVPEKIYARERFIDLHRVEGVWKHGYDFIG